MTFEPISRRRFASVLGAATGAAALLPARPGFARAGAPEATPSTPIRISSNENPYGPSEQALAAMTRSQEVAARYPDDSVREVVGALAKAHGVSPDQVVLGCGSSEVLRLADAAFLSAGKTVVVAEPTFEAVLDYARVTRAEAVKVPLTADFRHDLETMAAACDARTGLVYVCNPNNPTGTIVTAAEILAFLAKVPRSATVLVDEAYHHFVEDAGYSSATELISRFPNLVVARTFSKIHGMAGMRLGYALTTEANARALREHSSWANVNVAVARAGLASLADEERVARIRALMNGTRRRLCEELAKEGRRYIPSEANFLMIHVGRDAEPVIAAFKERGILVGRRFASLPEWLRVSIGTPEEMTAFLAGLQELVPARAAA